MDKIRILARAPICVQGQPEAAAGLEVMLRA